MNQTSYAIGLTRDDKIREKIKADEAHKELKQAYIDVQYAIAKLKVDLKNAEGLLLLDRQNIDLKLKINAIQQEVARQRVGLKEIEGKLNQSRFNIKKLTDEIEILKNEFFSARESGI